MAATLPRPAARGRRPAAELDARPLGALRSPWVAAWCVAAAVALLVRLPSLFIGPLGTHEAGYALDAWRLVAGRGVPGAYYRAAPGYGSALSVAVYALGGADVAVRLFGVVTGALAALLCAPTARLLGRSGALVAGALFALLPLWVGLGGTVSPDASAALLGVLGVSLIASRHLWPGALVVASAVAGFLLAWGATGIWIGVGVAALLLLVARGTWSPRRVIGCGVTYGVAALAGFSTFYTRPAPLASVRLPGVAYAGVADTLAAAGLSAWGLAWLVALLAVAALRVRGRAASEDSATPGAEGRRRSGGRMGAPRESPLTRGAGTRARPYAVGVALAALGLGLLLPHAYRPTSAAIGWALTWLLALLIPAAVAALVPHEWRRLTPVLALAVTLALEGATALDARDAPLASVPGGVASSAPAHSAVGTALERVRRVSAELYVLDRSLAEPRGGRKLSVELAPGLATAGRWYLRDFERVRVYPERGQAAEVQVLETGRSIPRVARSVLEPMGGGIALSWSRDAWRRIDPEAGNTVAGPKAVYALTDHGPPGSRPGQLSGPVDAAVDPAGNVYVVDQRNLRVQKYAPDGRYLDAWGARGEGEGKFADAGPNLGPTGIVASARYVWVADTWNHRIQQFTPDGRFVRAWGEFQDTRGQAALGSRFPRAFYGPRGIALGPDGLLYITDTGNKRVVVYRQDGRYVRQWGVGGSGTAALDEPIGIAVDRRGIVYIADSRNFRVQVFDSRGRHLRSWPVPEWAEEGRLEPYLDVDARGDVYVADPISGALYRYGPGGRRLATRSGDAERDLIAPLGVAVAPDGRVYVVDSALGNVLDLDRVR